MFKSKAFVESLPVSKRYRIIFKRYNILATTAAARVFLYFGKTIDALVNNLNIAKWLELTTHITYTRFSGRLVVPQKQLYM